MTESRPEGPEDQPPEQPEATDAPGDAAADAPEDTAREGSEEAPEPAAPEEIAEVGEEFLTGVLGSMGIEASVSSRIQDGRAVLEVSGEKLGVLIGRRGQTLDALQELARTAVQRRLRSRVALLVDVEGYRARRRSSLEEYAKAMARRAKERGTEIELESMNSYERKIVHDAVADVEGASSFSEGEEPDRKVIVRGE
jgi:spoIIIJ-associated protein